MCNAIHRVNCALTENHWDSPSYCLLVVEDSILAVVRKDTLLIVLAHTVPATQTTHLTKIISVPSCIQDASVAPAK